MTDMFDKFMKYSHLDETGHRRLNKDAPEKIKEEARQADNGGLKKQDIIKCLWIIKEYLWIISKLYTKYLKF